MMRVLGFILCNVHQIEFRQNYIISIISQPRTSIFRSFLHSGQGLVDRVWKWLKNQWQMRLQSAIYGMLRCPDSEELHGHSL